MSYSDFDFAKSMQRLGILAGTQHDEAIILKYNAVVLNYTLGAKSIMTFLRFGFAEGKQDIFRDV